MIFFDHANRRCRSEYRSNSARTHSRLTLHDEATDELEKAGCRDYTAEIARSRVQFKCPLVTQSGHGVTRQPDCYSAASLVG